MTGWPVGEGEMARRIRMRDWAATPLGPVEGWPTSLRTLVDMLLASGFPTIVLWGPELIQVYNDGYRDLMGAKHPDGLGERARDCWPEVWHINEPIYAHVLRGETVTFVDALYPVARSGRLEDAWFTLAYSPLRDGGEIAGVLVTVIETTGEVLGRRRLQESEARQSFLLALSDALRPLSDDGAIASEACRLVGERLDCDRTILAEVDPDGITLQVHDEHLRSGASSVLGRHDLDQFGELLGRELRAGRLLAVEDVSTLAGLGEEQRANYAAVETAAFMLVPLVHGGRLAACLTMGHRTPRRWSEADRMIARQAADRIWAEVVRARAEASLRDSEARFRAFVTASSDVVYRMSADWSAMERLEGRAFLSDTGAPSTDWIDRYIPPGDQPAVRAAIDRAIRDRSAVALEHRVVCADGSLGFMSSRAVPVLSEAGEVTGWLGTASDVTDAKVARSALRRSEARLRTLVEGVPQAVWRATEAGAWTWSSPQWTAYTGLSEEESRGDGWLAALHPDDRARAKAAWSASATGEPLKMETRVRQAATGSYRWFQSRALPMRGGSGAVTEWLGTSTDVHDLYELQDRRQILVAELQHRTRNLIGVVQAIFEGTLRSHGDLDAFAASYRDRLRALGRVQGLLSRLSDGDRVDFDALIHDEMRAIGVPAEDGKVTLRGPAGVALRSSTVQTLALAMHELATNALKYGALKQPKGRLAVTWRLARAGPDARPWLQVDWHESGVEMPPADAAPQGTGQGRQLIEHALPYQLGAVTSYVLSPHGVRCRIDLPVSSRTAAEEAADERASAL